METIIPTMQLIMVIKPMANIEYSYLMDERKWLNIPPIGLQDIMQRYKELEDKGASAYECLWICNKTYTFIKKFHYITRLNIKKS